MSILNLFFHWKVREWHLRASLQKKLSYPEGENASPKHLYPNQISRSISHGSAITSSLAETFSAIPSPITVDKVISSWFCPCTLQASWCDLYFYGFLAFISILSLSCPHTHIAPHHRTHTILKIGAICLHRNRVSRNWVHWPKDGHGGAASTATEIGLGPRSGGCPRSRP